MENRNRQNRQYKCRNCGTVKLIQTNHTESCIDYCPECSWKPSWRANPEQHKVKNDGLSVAFNGRTYRPFDCVEPAESKPEPTASQWDRFLNSGPDEYDHDSEEEE